EDNKRRRGGKHKAAYLRGIGCLFPVSAALRRGLIASKDQPEYRRNDCQYAPTLGQRRKRSSILILEYLVSEAGYPKHDGSHHKQHQKLRVKESNSSTNHLLPPLPSSLFARARQVVVT